MFQSPCIRAAATMLLLIAFSASPSDAVQLVARNRTGAAATVECVRKIDACSCETASGGRIDLSPLAKSGGDFAFGNRLGPSGQFNYFYNPCGGGTCDGSTDAAACQRVKSGSSPTEYLLGTQNTATFVTDPQIGLVLTYTALSGDKYVRKTELQLVCDTSGSGVSLFTPLDDGAQGTPIVYKMSLLSAYCCEVGPTTHDNGGGDGGISVGDILLITVFTLLFAYLAVSLAVNVLVLKRSGRERFLPNPTFWAALPGLVRDGAVFTFTAAKNAATKKRGQYDSI